jgi:hypothetical protein
MPVLAEVRGLAAGAMSAASGATVMRDNLSCGFASCGFVLCGFVAHGRALRALPEKSKPCAHGLSHRRAC